jgi:hypothetical protein
MMVCALRACRAASTQLAMLDFPAPERPVNQSTRRLVLLELATRSLADDDLLVVDIGGAPQSEVDHSRGDGLVRIAVDQK